MLSKGQTEPIYELFAHIGQTHLDQTQAPANAIKITPPTAEISIKASAFKHPGNSIF